MFSKLHYYIRTRLAPYSKILKLIPYDASVLELGCGHGNLIEFVSTSVNHITGVDFDKRKSSYADKKFKSYNNVEIIHDDIVRFLSQANKRNYSVIILSDTLASVPFRYQEETIEKAGALLENGGVVILKIQDVEPKWKFFIVLVIVSFVYKLLRLSISSNQEFFYQSRLYYIKLLEKHGFRITDVIMNRSFSLLPTVIIKGQKQ
jgi:predicted TPR repeat methyltransferase